MELKMELSQKQILSQHMVQSMERETPTRKMITPDTIGANRNRSFSITRVRHSTRR